MRNEAEDLQKLNLSDLKKQLQEEKEAKEKLNVHVNFYYSSLNLKQILLVV